MCFLLNPADREVDYTSFLLAKILGEESTKNKGKITCWCGRIPVAGVARGLGRIGGTAMMDWNEERFYSGI